MSDIHWGEHSRTISTPRRSMWAVVLSSFAALVLILLGVLVIIDIAAMASVFHEYPSQFGGARWLHVTLALGAFAAAFFTSYFGSWKEYKKE